MRDGGPVYWKPHTLSPGYDRNSRFAPTIVMRQAEGVMQRGGVRI